MNGAAAAANLLPALELEPAPGEAPDLKAMEVAIGAATAAAVEALAGAVVEWHETGRTAAARKVGGEQIAAVFELQQSAPAGFDFVAAVHNQGRAVLRERHAAAFRARGIDLESTADELIAGILMILGRVTAHLKAEAH